MNRAYIVGSGVHRFGLQGVGLTERVVGAGTAALADAGVEMGAVEELFVGHAGGGPMLAVGVVKDLGLTGLPVTRVENASATGASAFRQAVRAVEGGHVDVAMAIGFEAPKASFNRQQSGTRIADAAITPAAFFSLWAVRRMHDYGTTPETLAAIAAKNWNHARFAPWAERQADRAITADEVLASRSLAFPHTSMMGAPQGPGAAAVIVASERVARAQGGRARVRVLASVLRTETPVPGQLFSGSIVGPPELTRDTANAAYEAAGVGPDDLDLVQVHDAYAIEELLYYELLGICEDGQGDALVAQGATTLGGRIPFSTDGGLIGRGHPGGPTGLAQLHETTQQLRGESGARQVQDAHIGLCHITGAGAVCVVSILQRAQ